MWHCQKCGGPINSAEDGYVEWIVHQRRPSSHIHIVHAPGFGPEKLGCLFSNHDRSRLGGSLASDELRGFMGPDGLMRLLEKLADEEFGLDDAVELIKRIHIPRYDVCRSHFGEATRAGVVDDSVRPGYYLQDQLNLICQWIEHGAS